MAAPTLHASGTQVAVIGTEHILSSIAIAGVFTSHVDLNAMQAGDTLELRVYRKVLAGGVSRPFKLLSFTGAQGADAQISDGDPFGNELAEADGLKFTLKQTVGTGRSFPWKVLKYT